MSGRCHCSELYDQQSIMSLHQLPKFLKQIRAIMRPGGGLGMVLNAEDGFAAMTHAFERAVVQIDMRGFQVSGQGVEMNGKPMILSGNLHLAGALIDDRLIDAPMAKLELESLAA
jgi:hypothetical protein